MRRLVMHVLRSKISLMFLLVSLALTACSTATPPSTQERIRLPMGFVPNVQYAPFYVAADKGYFEEAGLDINFDYSSETDGVALVGSGELQFSLASGEQVLLAREQGAPVVYVLAWWQDYPVAVASLSEQGISRPEDLSGLDIGLPGRYGASYIGYIALMRAAGLSPEAAQLDSIGFNQVEALATGQDQAVVIYANNEPIQLRAQGYQIDVMRVSDYVELASNGLITNEATIENRPELVERMVGAILRGLKDTIDDPEAAYEISTKYVDGLSEADREVQMQVLETSIEFWTSETLGFSEPAAWQNMQDVLFDMGLLDNRVDVEQAYTNEFVSDQ